MSYIALILRSESRFHVLVCADMCAVEINIEAFLRAPSKGWFQHSWQETQSPVSGINFDCFSSSLVAIVLVVFRSLKYVWIPRKDWKLEKWDLLLIYNFLGYRMSLFSPDGYFISSEQHHDTQLTVPTEMSKSSSNKCLSVWLICSLSLNIWPFLKHFSLTESIRF